MSSDLSLLSRSGIATGLTPDSVLGNVYHGDRIVACGGQVRASFIVVQNCTIATALKSRIDDLAGVCDDGVIVRTMEIIELSPLLAEERTPVVLVTNEIPTRTFSSWIDVSAPSLTTIKLFMRKLGSAVCKLHQVGKYVGDPMEDVRVVGVQGNFSPVILPQQLEGDAQINTDSGVRKDILSARSMIFEAFAVVGDDTMVRRVVDEDALLFLYLCDNAIPLKQNNLREASYLVFHAPLLWNDYVYDDFYHFVMALHQYSATFQLRFDEIVADKGGRRCIDLDWRTTLEEIPMTYEAFILKGPHYYKSVANGHFAHSASFVYFLRCVLQHARFPHDIKSLVQYIKKVFPTAAVVLYKMLHDRLFEVDGHSLPLPMPRRVVDFIKNSPHRFQF